MGGGWLVEGAPGDSDMHAAAGPGPLEGAEGYRVSHCGSSWGF